MTAQQSLSKQGKVGWHCHRRKLTKPTAFLRYKQRTAASSKYTIAAGLNEFNANATRAGLHRETRLNRQKYRARLSDHDVRKGPFMYAASPDQGCWQTAIRCPTLRSAHALAFLHLEQSALDLNSKLNLQNTTSKRASSWLKPSLVLTVYKHQGEKMQNSERTHPAERTLANWTDVPPFNFMSQRHTPATLKL